MTFSFSSDSLTESPRTINDTPLELRANGVPQARRAVSTKRKEAGGYRESASTQDPEQAGARRERRK